MWLHGCQGAFSSVCQLHIVEGSCTVIGFRLEEGELPRLMEQVDLARNGQIDKAAIAASQVGMSKHYRASNPLSHRVDSEHAWNLASAKLINQR